MEPPVEKSDRYLVALLQDAFADDPRTEELGVDVAIAGDTVVLSGTVATPQRRENVAAVAREAVGDRAVRNDVTVADLSEPPDVEQMP